MTRANGGGYGLHVRLPSALLVALTLLLAGCDKLAQMVSEEPPREQQARSYLAKGRAALSKGDLATAQRLLEKAAALNPTDPEPQRTLGGVYEKLGEQAQAIFALKRAAELAPSDPGPRKELAELYLRSSQPANAAEHLKKAVDASGGEDTDLLRQLAFAQLRSGQVDEADAIAKKVNEASPGDADTMALMAEVLIAKRQEETAVQLLDQAVEAHPNSARVRTARARYFFSRGKVNEALREFELAAEAAPDDTEIGLARARAMAASGQTEEAAELMGKIVAARPTDLNAQSSLAEVLLLADKVEEAQNVAKAVIDKQPKNGRALYVRARAIEVQSADDPVRAINAYQGAIEGDPNQTEALSRLWRLYLKQNQKNDAISMLERLRILGEATADEDIELVGLYADTGINPVEGLKMCNEALKRDPGNAKLLGFKRQLEAKVPRAARPKGDGTGIQVIKGRGK